jgi:enterochelin esterase-like enzyme
VALIDDHYRTIPERSARAIIGISAGEYGATLIAIHHPETYYGKTFFGFYIGAQDPYNGFVDDNEALNDELTAAGIPHVFKLYQGGHNGTFWREHQDEWLAEAVQRLDPPS